MSNFWYLIFDVKIWVNININIDSNFDVQIYTSNFQMSNFSCQNDFWLVYGLDSITSLVFCTALILTFLFRKWRRWRQIYRNHWNARLLLLPRKPVICFCKVPFGLLLQCWMSSTVRVSANSRVSQKLKKSNLRINATDSVL